MRVSSRGGDDRSGRPCFGIDYNSLFGVSSIGPGFFPPSYHCMRPELSASSHGISEVSGSGMQGCLVPSLPPSHPTPTPNIHTLTHNYTHMNSQLSSGKRATEDETLGVQVWTSGTLVQQACLPACLPAWSLRNLLFTVSSKPGNSRTQ